jgi:hypothetical protein
MLLASVEGASASLAGGRTASGNDLQNNCLLITEYNVAGGGDGEGRLSVHQDASGFAWLNRISYHLALVD